MRTAPVLLIVGLLASRALVAQAEAPWIGTWKLVSPQSASDVDSPFKRVTVRIEAHEDGLLVIYDTVRWRGGITHLEWSGRFDEKDYPLQGLDDVVTNAYKQVDGRTYDIVQKSDGEATATTRVTFSPDGRTMTTVTRGTNGRSQQAVYTRQ